MKTRPPKSAPTTANTEDKSPSIPRLDLTTMEHVRAELARLYRQAKNGNLDISSASKLAYILSLLAKIIEGSDIEKRIEALEANPKQGK